MPGKVQIIRTTDGSCTLYLEDLNETYHSTHGALAESLHVYIANGLRKLSWKRDVNILEIGFGTGLNALLSIDHMDAKQHINYYTVEPYLLDTETILDYYGKFENKPDSFYLLEKLLQAPFNKLRPVTGNFNFCLLDKTLQTLEAKDVHYTKFDLVYYDAFGPSKQAEMWTTAAIQKATDLMAGQGMLTTYCAQGQFKRNLKALGLSVENPVGALGKREMTVGRKL
jgi:tRNA U34 5-methylaminomethyl-2-thiouridine-forming methyltransferase MnmC